MKIWIILLAVAALQIVNAKSLNDKQLKRSDSEIAEILSNIPEDIDTDELIRFLYDIINREVSLIFNC